MLEGVGEVGALVPVAEQGAEAAHPRDPLVALVPHQGQVTAGAQDAVDLRQGALEVEPVERLAGHHHVDTGVGQRDLLGTGDGGPHQGQPGAQPLQHGAVGVGGVHLVTEPDQDLGELAGAGPELEDGRGLLAHEPARGRGGVRRAATVVGVGDRPEAAPRVRARLEVGHRAKTRCWIASGT